MHCIGKLVYSREFLSLKWSIGSINGYLASSGEVGKIFCVDYFSVIKIEIEIEIQMHLITESDSALRCLGLGLDLIIMVCTE